MNRLNADVRWTSACRQLDDGNTLIKSNPSISAKKESYSGTIIVSQYGSFFVDFVDALKYNIHTDGLTDKLEFV